LWEYVFFEGKLAGMRRADINGAFAVAKCSGSFTTKGAGDMIEAFEDVRLRLLLLLGEVDDLPGAALTFLVGHYGEPLRRRTGPVAPETLREVRNALSQRGRSAVHSSLGHVLLEVAACKGFGGAPLRVDDSIAAARWFRLFEDALRKAAGRGEVAPLVGALRKRATLDDAAAYLASLSGTKLRSGEI
jgi:hypothetical protein